MTFRSALVLLILGASPAWTKVPEQPNELFKWELDKTIGDIHRLQEDDAKGAKAVMIEIEERIGYRYSEGQSKGKLARPKVYDQDAADSGVSTEDIAQAQHWREVWDAGVAQKYKGLSTEDKERYAEATLKHQRNRKLLEQLCNQAIKEAEDTYHIAPVKKEGVIVQGSPKGSDGTGEYVRSYRGQTARWRPYFRDTEEAGEVGATDMDGSVHINPDAFASAGLLGYTLYHESQHFDELLDTDVRGDNVAARELAHRREHEKYMESVFQLGAKELLRNKRMERKYEIDAKEYDKKLKAGLSPWRKADRKKFPSDHLAVKLLSVGNPEDIDEVIGLEKLRTGGTASFYGSVREFKAMADEAKRSAAAREAELDRQWKGSPEYAAYLERSRADEARRQEEDARSRAAWNARRRQEMAERLRFQELFANTTPDSAYGFQDDHRHVFYYQDGMIIGDEEAKVMMTLADNCIAATGGRAADSDAIYGISGILSSRWNNPDFRSHLYVGTQRGWRGEPNPGSFDSAANCVNFAVSTLKPPFRGDDLLQVFFRFKAAVSAERQRIQDLYRIQHPARQEPSHSSGGNSGGNGGQSNRNGGGGGGGGDWTPEGCKRTSSRGGTCPVSP